MFCLDFKEITNIEPVKNVIQYSDDNKYKNECGKCCSKCMDRQTHLCKKSCFYLTFRCDECRHQ